MTAPPEYLPRPEGYEDRVAALRAAGTPEADAHWMAACEAIGAVGRSENNHRDMFWHNDAAYNERETWDRISLREAQRYYFHQRKDTLVGYLADGRHNAQLNTKMGHDRMERLVAFIKANDLWNDWLAHNRARVDTARRENNT